MQKQCTSELLLNGRTSWTHMLLMLFPIVPETIKSLNEVKKYLLVHLWTIRHHAGLQAYTMHVWQYDTLNQLSLKNNKKTEVKVQ